MSTPTVKTSLFSFLTSLQNNNHKEWFESEKELFKEEEQSLKVFFSAILENLRKEDEIAEMKIYRIYRDVRFSKDKTPYKNYRSCSFSRSTALRRGGYHIELTPNESFVAIGFWQPNTEDLYRIRKEIELDGEELVNILNTEPLKSTFNGFYDWESLKTAPKGFDKNHPLVHLLRKKDFILMRKFTNEEVLAPDFVNTVVATYLTARPFLDYMSHVLTTDLNGESLI